jgi:hypothetical protein
MGSVRTRKVRINQLDWDEEFGRGVREHSEWIHDEKSRKHVVSRKKQSADKYEEAFFFGVLTGSKRANPQGFAPPKNWRGQPPNLDPSPTVFTPPYPGWKPRMVKKK